MFAVFVSGSRTVKLFLFRSIIISLEKKRLDLTISSKQSN